MSPHLGFDIEVEVIKRLPVKSLIQCRSVCKAWNSLIGSSRFIVGYNFRHDQPEHLFVKYEIGDRQETRKVKYVCFLDDDTFPRQKFSPTVPPRIQLLYQSRVIGISCGLFCFSGLYRERDNPKTDMVVLWNPSIRESIAVVVPNPVSKQFNYVVGFGVCPGTKDPKLVKVTYIQDHRKMGSISCIPCQVMVFTLSSREWTCLCSDQLPRKSIQFDNTCQTVIGQFIYWVAYDHWIAFGDKFRYRCLILSFDLSTNEFREVRLPNSLANKRESDMSISRLKESLAVVEYTTDITSKRVCSVWMMESGDSKAFTKLFTINAANTSVLSTLAFKKSGESIVAMEDDAYPDSYKGSPLVIYDPCSEHIKDLLIRGNGYPISASFYTESLLLLDHDGGYFIKCGVVNK